MKSNFYILASSVGKNSLLMHIALKGKEVETNIEAKTLTLHGPKPLGRLERSDIEVVYISIFFIKLPLVLNN